MVGFVKLFELPLREKFHEVVLHSETLVFITTAIVATVTEVESGSTFRQTSVATDGQKVPRKPTMLHGAMPGELVSQRRCTQVSAKSFNL